MIVSVHMQKTAGSSFRKGLKSHFGKRLLLDYGEDMPLGPPIYSWPKRWRGRLAVRFQTDRLIASYDAVHGHFVSSKYLPLGDRAILCAFFRDPTDRIISQYRYSLRPQSQFWHTRYRGKFLTSKLYVSLSRSGEKYKVPGRLLTLGQYASRPRHRSYYALMMGGVPMDRFAFVGITEEYEASLVLFSAIFGIDIPYHRLNVNEAIPDKFSAKEKEAVRATQCANYSIYDAARRRFDALYSQWCR